MSDDMSDFTKKDKLRVDFHCHTNFSKDSLTKPESLVKMCLRKGLDRIVVTDHNAIDGALEAHRLDPGHVIGGEEIMTTCGEILAAYVKEKIPGGLNPFETIQLLQAQGAFISISHPFDTIRNGSWNMNDLLPILPIVNAIEGFNSRIIAPDANRKALLFAKEHNLAITAGSDAHAAFELGAASIWLDPFSDAEGLKFNINHGILTSKKTSWWVHLISTYAKYHNKLS
jgi:predicted metal-dependent phosphoesterase TrpH